MTDHFYAVIMAGGGGTRLWPLSRQSNPKQMLRLFGQRTLFEIAVDRLEGLFPPERIFVVTVADQAAALSSLRPAIPAENFLIEPTPRGTASVVGLAAAALHARDPQAVMAILTADHFIQDEALFRRMLAAAHQVAQAGRLVTLGIEPTYPATGYGYIQRGALLGDFDGLPVYQVARFVEKPDEDQARRLLESGSHAWNSGMFIWQAQRILGEFERQMPDLAAELRRIEQVWNTPKRDALIGAIWPGLRSETIDYGIMEHAQDVVVLPGGGLGWNDVGSWESLFDVLEPNADGNIVVSGEQLTLDTDHSLLVGQPNGRLIVTIGMHDVVVVDTGDALLVCHRAQSQRVKEIVNQLKQTGRGQFL